MIPANYFKINFKNYFKINFKSGCFICFQILFVFVSVANQTRDDDLELEEQLRILNKPAIKTFENEYGDIFNCVDMYGQPAFDNPLLKNHKIQLEPSLNVRTMFNKVASLREYHTLGSEFKIYCPNGTVPIRRITKQDLIRAKSFFKSYNSKGIQEGDGFHVAGIQTKRDQNKIYRGTVAIVSLNAPYIYDDRQWSGAMISVEAGKDAQHDYIRIGWMVNPGLNHDSSTRLYTLWVTGRNKRGCYNQLCSGFVQTSFNISLDHVFRVSDYIDYAVMGIAQDQKTGNWWLVYGQPSWIVGYWPKELFTSLEKGADYMELGGKVYDSGENLWPAMGTGKYSDTHYGVTAFMRKVFFADESFKTILPDNAFLNLQEDRCYVAGDNSYKSGNPDFMYSFLYGGRGGPKDQCV